MSLFRGSVDDALEALGRGQVLECVQCDEVIDRSDVLEGIDVLFTSDDDVRCPECACRAFRLGYLQRAPTGRKIAERWGEDVAACGWTALPNVILDNATALGLRPIDLALLLEHETYRRGRDDAAWPRAETQAQRIGCTEKPVRESRKRMREAGYIEAQRRRTRSGSYAATAFTRNGLTEVAALIAANRRAEIPDETGLPELLRRLRERAREHLPAVSATDGNGLIDRWSPVDSAGEEEAVKEEALEKDSAKAAAPVPVAVSLSSESKEQGAA